MSTNEPIAETEDSLAEFETMLTNARAASADAVRFESEWGEHKRIRANSELAAYADDALTHFLAGRVAQTAKDAD